MSKPFIIGVALNAQVEGELSDGALNALTKVGNFTKYRKVASEAGPWVGVIVGQLKN